MDNKLSGWLSKFADSLALKKHAIDKLPDDELDSGLPDPNDPSAGAGDDPSQGGAGDPMAGMDPSMMGMDPSMMMPPPPEPKVWDNKYLVNCDQTKFIVELTPSIVLDPTTDPAAQPPPDAQQAQADPMADQSLNPNADPALLQQWMHESDDNDKAFAHDDQGTVDPLSKQQEGISDTGNEQSVKVHQKALLKRADGEGQDEASPLPKTPGADRSNAYPPCKYCANFNAAENSCSQGLDVEKVQAAQSCSWLNSTMQPFNGPTDPDSTHKDEDTVNEDITKLPGGGGMNQSVTATASLNYNRKDKALKSYLEKIWD